VNRLLKEYVGRHSFRLFVLIITICMTMGTIQAQNGLYDLPDSFAPISISSPIAVTRAGRILVANPFTNIVSIIGLERSLDAEFEIGLNPNSVAILPDTFRAVALSSEELVLIDLEENTISATYPLEGMPFAVVATDTTAYVSLQAANEVIGINLEDGEIVLRVPTPAAPSGLALWGDFLYVTHFFTGEFSLIYLPIGEVVRTIQTAPDAGMSVAIEINPINGLAYLPQSLRNNSAFATVDNRIRPMVYEIDLKTMSVLRGIDLGEAVQGTAAFPYAARQPSNRSRLYISLAGSNGILVLNLDTGIAENFVETGLYPLGLIFSPNYGRLYVQDALEGTVSLFDTRFFGLEDQIPNSSASLSAQEQIAARLFYTVDTRTSANGMLTCATCHWNGEGDKREWLGATTPPLFETEIETEWLNAHIIEMMGGSGLDVESIDMDALIEFLRG
jgi:DNA-binding beta-propeller fold protein YncE